MKKTSTPPSYTLQFPQQLNQPPSLSPFTPNHIPSDPFSPSPTILTPNTPLHERSASISQDQLSQNELESLNDIATEIPSLAAAFCEVQINNTPWNESSFQFLLQSKFSNSIHPILQNDPLAFFNLATNQVLFYHTIREIFAKTVSPEKQSNFKLEGKNLEKFLDLTTTAFFATINPKPASNLHQSSSNSIENQNPYIAILKGLLGDYLPNKGSFTFKAGFLGTPVGYVILYSLSSLSKKTWAIYVFPIAGFFLFASIGFLFDLKKSYQEKHKQTTLDTASQIPELLSPSPEPV